LLLLKSCLAFIFYQNIITFAYTCTGMFPYVCAAMIPVFCDLVTTSKMLRTAVETVWNHKPRQNSIVYKPPSRTKQNAIVTGVCVYTVLQLFLPYSHIVTQVYKHASTDCFLGIQTLILNCILIILL